MKNRVLITGMMMALAFVSSIQATDNPRLAVGWIGGVGIYNPLNGEEIWRNDLEATRAHGRNVPQYISFINPNDNSILVGFNQHSVFYNNSSKISVENASKLPGLAYLIVKNTDLYEVITTASNGELIAYNFHTGIVTRNFTTTNPRGATSLALYELNGTIFIIAGTTKGYIDIYEYESQNLVHSINAYEDGVHCGSFIVNIVVLSDGVNKKVIASTAVIPVPTDSGQIACWDLRSFQKEYCVDFAERVHRTKGPDANDGDTNAILVYKDTDGSQKMVVSGRDRERVIKIWDPFSGKCIKKIKAEQFENTIFPIQAFESNHVVKLIVGYLAGYLAIWNTQTCELEASVYQNQNKVSTVIRAITLFEVGDVQYCTVGSDSGDMYTYELNKLTLVANWSVGQHSISAQACSHALSGNPEPQLGYFSQMIGCNVPFADLGSFCRKTNP